MKRRHALAAAAGACAACAVLAGCASAGSHAAAGSGATVIGPASVLPGRTVRLSVTGFRPGDSVTIVLAPADKGPCCGVEVPAPRTVDSNGTATLSFAMPTAYRRCTAAGACVRVAWRVRERVTVTVSGYLEQAQATTAIGSRNV